MARLWSSGFELNTTGTAEWSNANGTVQSTNVRSGTYAGRTAVASSNATGFCHQFKSVAGTGETYGRAYIYINTLPATTAIITSFYDSASFSFGGSAHSHIKLSTSGTLQLFNGVTQIGSDSTTLSTGQWYRIELHMNSTPSAGSQVLEARLDGVQFAGASNLTLSLGSVLSFTVGANLGGGAATVTGTWDWDDFAVNDSTGSFQNSWPDSGSIVYLRPNAAGDNTLWTSTGTNWTAVSEVTPDSATSTNSTATSGNIDDYNITNTPGAIGTSDTINVIQIGARFAGTTAIQANNIQFKFRFKSSSGGTVSESVAVQANSTSFVTNMTANPRNYPLTLYQTPDATTLTKANLDTSQIGLNCTVSSGTANTTAVTAEWLLVEYTPNLIPPTSVPPSTQMQYLPPFLT